MSTATPKSQNLEACARFFRSSCDKRVPGDGGELVVSSFGASVTEKAKTPTKHTSTTRTKWQQLDTNMLYYVIWLYLYHAACHQTNTSSNPKVQAGGGGGACLLEQQVLKRSSQGIIRMCFQSEKNPIETTEHLRPGRLHATKRCSSMSWSTWSALVTLTLWGPGIILLSIAFITFQTTYTYFFATNTCSNKAKPRPWRLRGWFPAQKLDLARIELSNHPLS